MRKYQFTDLGIVLNNPASMGSNRGIYYPTVIETKDITGWQAPYTHIVYFSTDHDTGDGGIWCFLVNGDPTNPSNWVDYDDALALGHFDYLTTKPSGNPIYIDTESRGTQTETPCARVINGSVYMTTHNNSGPSYDGDRAQTTSMQLSSDGLNFSWQGYILTYDPRYGVGDGHTGYFKWSENPFPEYEYDYVGYSIHGGGDGSWYCLWGANEGELDQPWAELKLWKRDSGRIFDNDSTYSDPQLIYRLNPQSMLAQEDGSFIAIATTKEQGTSGTDLAIESSVQILLDKDGVTPLSEIDFLIPHSSYNINYIELGEKITYDGREFMLYRALGSGNTSTVKAAIGIAEYSFVSGSLPMLNPANTERKDITFIGASSLPSNVKTMTGNGTLNFTPNGLEITIPAGQSEGLYLTDIKTDMKILDVSWLNARLTTFDYWRPHAGFAKDYVRGSALSANNAIFTSYEDSDQNDKQITLIQKIEGVESSSSFKYDRVGYGGSYGDGESVQAPTSYGVRWMPSEGRATITNAGIERNFVSASSMPSGEYVPFIEIENTEATDPITVIIEGIGFGQAGDINFQWELDNKPAGSTTAIPDDGVKNFDFAPDVEGEYQFSLTASDSNGSGAANRTFSIASINQPPVANAGPDQSVAAGVEFILDGTGSQDTDGTIVEYRWTQIAGDPVILDTSTPSQPKATSPSRTSAQTLTFQLITVDDEGEESAPGTVNVNVAAVVLSEILKVIERLDFDLVTQGDVNAYFGRANREVMKLKPSDPTGLALDADGFMMLDSNTIEEIKVIAEGGSISSKTDSINLEGSEMLVRLGDLEASKNGNIYFSIVVFVEGDTKGVVVSSKGSSGNKSMSYVTL